VPTLLDDGEGNTVCGVIQRVAHRPRGVRDPVHAWTLYAREPGGLSSTRLFDWVGQGRPVAYNPDKYAAEKSDIGVVPMKVPNKILVASINSIVSLLFWFLG